MGESNRKSIEVIYKLPQFTTMNVIDGQAGLIIYASLIFYSLTINNILNIIVLLILAGIAIMALTGENGILNQAINANKQTDIAGTKEQIKLELVGRYDDEGDYTNDDVIEAVKTVTGQTVEEGAATVTTAKGNEVDISDLWIASTEESIDWENILADLPVNYEQYLSLAQENGQTTEVNIGIGTDGKVVNLDLWHYYKTDDGESMSLGEVLRESEGYVGYDEKNIVDGKIQGTMPQYVYVATENKVYTVTSLEATFSGLTSLIYAPQIPATITNIGHQAFKGTGLTTIIIPWSVTNIHTYPVRWGGILSAGVTV